MRPSSLSPFSRSQHACSAKSLLRWARSTPISHLCVVSYMLSRAALWIICDVLCSVLIGLCTARCSMWVAQPLGFFGARAVQRCTAYKVRSSAVHLWQLSCLPCSVLDLTGTKRRCLNLGSYNYLGYANADPYCTPMVIKTMEQYGWGMCSSRTDAGGWCTFVAGSTQSVAVTGRHLCHRLCPET